MALKTSNSPYGESAIQSHCVRAYRRNDAAQDYCDDLKRIQQIYKMRGYTEERVRAITLKMRVKLLIKAGETKKAWRMLRRSNVVKNVRTGLSGQLTCEVASYAGSRR